MSNRVAVPCCLAVLEIAWLTPWSYLLGATTTGMPLLPPLAMILILIAAASLTARMVGQEELSARDHVVQVVIGVLVALAATWLAPGTAAGWPASLLAEAIAIPTGGISFHLLALLGAAGLWQQGILLGRSRMGDRGVARRVSIGVSGLAGVALVSRSSAPALEQVILPVAVIAFLLAALLASTLADLEEVRAGSRDRQAQALSRSWLGLVVGTACVLLATGLAVASLTERQGLHTLQVMTHILLPIVDFLIFVIAIPFAFVADLLFQLIQLFRGGQHAQPTLQPIQSPFAHLQPSTMASPPPEWLAQSVGIVIGLLSVLVVIALLWAALRRFHVPPPDADVLEERRSVWSWADILAPLRRQPHSAVGVDETVDAVRAAYRRFLTLAAFNGQARQFTETPLEYRQRLQRQSLVDSEAIEVLTERYQRVRYGPDRATAEDAAAAKVALARLQRALQTHSKGDKLRTLS